MILQHASVCRVAVAAPVKERVIFGLPFAINDARWRCRRRRERHRVASVIDKAQR